MTLGQTIMHLRTKRGWSQDELSGKLDVSRQSISKWETDTSVPELDKLMNLASLFGVTLDALVNGEVEDVPLSREAPIQDEKRSQIELPKRDEKPMQTEAEKHASAVSEQRPAKTASVVLFCMAACLFVFDLFFGTHYLPTAILIAVPFLSCGIICYFCRRHTVLYCAWAVFAFLYYCLTVTTGNYCRDLGTKLYSLIHIVIQTGETRFFANILPLFGGLIMMLGVTLYAFRRQRVEPTKKTVTLISIGWAVYLAIPFLYLLLDPPSQDPTEYIRKLERLGRDLYGTMLFFMDAMHTALFTVLLLFTVALIRTRIMNKRRATK